MAGHSLSLLALSLDTSWRQWLETCDARLFVLINSRLHGAWLDPLMLVLSSQWSLVVPLVGLLIYRTATATQRKQDWLRAAFLLVVIGVADGTATALKGLVCRPRPCHALAGVQLLVRCSESFSFPSNHAANIFALAVLLAAYDRKRAAIWLGVAILVGFSRVYLGVHYPSDVVAGAILGTGLGCASAALAARLAALRKPDETQAGK